MECPKCGAKMQVLDSAGYKKHVYRRRRCKECGYAMHTEELRIKDSIGRLGLRMGKNKKGREQ